MTKKRATCKKCGEPVYTHIYHPCGEQAAYGYELVTNGDHEWNDIKDWLARLYPEDYVVSRRLFILRVRNARLVQMEVGDGVRWYLVFANGVTRRMTPMNLYPMEGFGIYINHDNTLALIPEIEFNLIER